MASVHMNDAGQIAGSYAGSNYVYSAFLRDTNGTVTLFSVSGAPTTLSDINQGGFIVGGYGARKMLSSADSSEGRMAPSSRSNIPERPSSTALHSPPASTILGQSPVDIK
jgi:hypothetical protein